MQYEVVEVQSQTQIDRQKAGMSLQGLKHHRQMSEGVQSPQDEEESGKSSPRQSDRLISKSIPLTDVEWGAVSPGWGEGVRDC